MTLDRLLHEAGVHIDALIDQHLGAATNEAGWEPPSDQPDGDGIVVLAAHRLSDTVARPVGRRWAAVAAAMILLALVVGIGIVLDQGDDPAPAESPPTKLTNDRELRDGHLDTVVYDGRWLWSTRRGSTFLDRRDPTTGAVVASFNLPASTSLGVPVVHGPSLYVPTWNGVVVVDTATGTMHGPMAKSDAGEVVAIAVGDDAIWLCRRDLDSQTLERWTSDLATRTVDIDLGPEQSSGIAASGTTVYVSTWEKGLQRYGADGRLVSTVDGVGGSFAMRTGADGTVWVAEAETGDLVAVDPSIDRVLSRVNVADAELNSVDVTTEGVWVTAYGSRMVAFVDPVGGSVTVRAWLPAPPQEVAFVGDAAWVAGEGGWALRFVPG